MEGESMEACLKLGGDPTLGHKVEILKYEVPYNIIEILKTHFPDLQPLQFKYPLEEIPDVQCCTCRRMYVLTRPRLESMMTCTHVHSSLELHDGDIFILCHNGCDRKIRQILEEHKF